MSDDGKPQDPGRRRMLTRLGLTAGMAYAAPVLLRLGDAQASGSGGGSGGGRGAASASFSRARPARRRASAPSPEIVVVAPAPADLDLIAAQGYALLARDDIATIGVQIGRFSLPGGRSIDEARSEILQLVPAALFDLNHIYRTSELACSPEGCAAFEMIGWAAAAPACQAAITIGMIDTGINAGHDALSGVDVSHASVIGPQRRPSSKMHGTAIAVLLAGRADSRTPGLLAGTRLLAVEAFHADGAGHDAADAFDLARALDRLAGSPAKVINLSFAGPANTILERMVAEVLRRDIVLVAAAGNSGPNAAPLFPAAYAGVVAVTAVDRRSTAYRQAAAGDQIDFAAPGVRLWTAASVSGGRFRSGTSYAAPFVTAAAATARAADPGASSAQIVERLAAGAVDLGPAGRDETYGWGLVQAPGTCANDLQTVPADMHGEKSRATRE